MTKPRFTDVVTTALEALSMIGVTLSFLFVVWTGVVRTIGITPVVAFVAGVFVLGSSVVGIYLLIRGGSGATENTSGIGKR